MGGDAYEVKKIGTLDNDLALNSSYPKHKLYSNDRRIKRECKICDGGSWTEKGIVYIVGTVARNTLKSLWFVYGDCYAASLEHYTHIAAQITDSITGSGIELGTTTELARVNRVDPLGITNLRVRGMWSIQHPARVFAYILHRNHRSVPVSMTAIMRAENYLSFNEQHRADLEALRDNVTVFIDDVHIRDPNNPANMIDAKMIQFLSS